MAKSNTPEGFLPEGVPGNESSPVEKSLDERFDEDAVFEELEHRDKAGFETLIAAERTLSQAFKGAEQAMPTDTLNTQQYEAIQQRLLNLSDALSGLEAFKDRLPKRYQAHISAVLENTELIKQMLRAYVRWENPTYGRLSVNEVALDVILKLRRIDPERFSKDIVTFTDEDLKALSFPAGERGLWNELLHGARLAEYDPKRFRRLFGMHYPPAVIAEMRTEAERLDPRDQEHVRGDTPQYRELLAKLERALQSEDPEDKEN